MRSLVLLPVVFAGCTAAPSNTAATAEVAVPDRPIAAATPAPTPVATPAPAAIEAPEAVVRRYAAAIAAGRHADAWALWDDGGKASGLSAEAFAESFARYASFDAVVGAAGRGDAGAGQRHVTVPVRVTGELADGGGEFVLEGPVMLHRVADGIESDDPAAHQWRISDSALKPRPLAVRPAPTAEGGSVR